MKVSGIKLEPVEKLVSGIKSEPAIKLVSGIKPESAKKLLKNAFCKISKIMIETVKFSKKILPQCDVIGHLDLQKRNNHNDR